MALLFALVAALLGLALPAQAATIVLDFEEEDLGFHGPSFLSAECSCVELSDTNGEHLDVISFNGSRVLVVGLEGGSLALEFLVPVTSVMLDFGNDQAGPEDQPVIAQPATLSGFAEDTLIASTTVEPNRDGFVNQTIALSTDRPIDRAVFSFRQLGEHSPIDPIVDNIRLETVPEPGTLGPVALGFAIALSRRPS